MLWHRCASTRVCARRGALLRSRARAPHCCSGCALAAALERTCCRRTLGGLTWGSLPRLPAGAVLLLVDLDGVSSGAGADAGAPCAAPGCADFGRHLGLCAHGRRVRFAASLPRALAQPTAAGHSAR
eukprot:Amastigsp_a844558_36.p7 type:complete len:127 gc:universal Amastigsp_a844558_36:1493-1873(+)